MKAAPIAMAAATATLLTAANVGAVNVARDAALAHPAGEHIKRTGGADGVASMVSLQTVIVQCLR
jgi:IS5 family transposase